MRRRLFSMHHMHLLRRSLNLRNAVIVVVLLPLLAVFGVGGFLVLTALEQRLEARLQDDIALIARTLKVPLARALERQQEYSLERALRSASEFGRVYGVYVYDAAGTPIARADQRMHRSVDALPELDLERQRTTAAYGSVDGREVYSYFTPLTDGSGQAIGMLQVTRRASEIRDYLDTLRTNVALVMLGFCGLFVAIIIAGHHLAIGRPLRRLAGAMQQVALGDTGVRAATGGPQEIRSLASRFNSMVHGISERDAVLEEERARQVRLEQTLRQSEKYALVGRLAAGVAHELGAPLSVVDGQAQRLMRSSTLTAQQQAMAARIRESAARMTAIVHQLLGFGRSSEAEARPISVRRVVHLAAADVRSQFDDAGAALEVAAAPDTRIVADEGRLREALVHLLRNALHACGGGRARIGWRRQAGSLCVFVENSGAPIPIGDRERIFEPFFTTKPQGAGSGLGLAIVKGAVVDHGAEITAYDSALGGAGFRIEFPDEGISE